MKRLILFLISVLLLIFVGGCGSDAIPVVKVSGSVTYRGEPLADALVTFHPTAAGGRAAAGMSKEDGSFQLMTQGACINGCLPGSYGVTISKTILVDRQGNPIVFSTEEPPPGSPTGQRPESRSILPAKYENVATSGLTAVVHPKKNNPFVFDLQRE